MSANNPANSLANQSNCTPSVVWPREWINKLLTIPWSALDSQSRVETAGQLLHSLGLATLTILAVPDEDMFQIRSLPSLNLALPGNDPLIMALEKLTPAEKCKPVLLTRANMSQWPHSANDGVSHWLASRQQMLVMCARPVDHFAYAFILVDPGTNPPEALTALLTILCQHIEAAIAREAYQRQAERFSMELKVAEARLLDLAQVTVADQTVNAVAHQLNNCLTSILGYSQLLLETGLHSPEEKAYLKHVFSEAERMARIVENMLTFARRRHGGPELTDINELIHETLALHAYELEKHNVAVSLHLDDQLPLTIATPYKLQIVFLNILMNACQAIVDRRGPGTIVIRTYASGDPSWITIEFQDNGVGIPEELLNLVFEPFFTTHESTTHLGLGLAVCQKLIREHRGVIYARRAPESGTVVTVELPVVTSLDARQPSSQARILIVDDEEDVAILLGRLLEAKDFQVDVALSAEAALAHVAKTEYQCILLDIKMPGMDGRQLYRRLLQENEALADRFVFVTGDSASPEASKFLAETGAPWVQKPFDLFEVERAVQRMITKG